MLVLRAVDATVLAPERGVQRLVVQELAVEQDAGKTKIADRAFENRVGACSAALNLQAVPAANDLAGDGVGKTRFNAITQALCLKLKRWNGNGLYVFRQAGVGDRFIAFGKTANKNKGQ